MKIALCQLNPIIGDVEKNTELICRALSAHAADLFIFSELFIQGYPPRDLLEQPYFVQQGMAAAEKLCCISQKYPGRGILFGCAVTSNKKYGKGLSNSALLIADGKILFRQDKSLLPTYDVFDELRYFDPASGVDLFIFKGYRLGITICEDAWNEPSFWPQPIYDFDPVASLVQKGADLLINISASPFSVGKEQMRIELLKKHSLKHGKPFFFVNQVGANDELVFDGGSMVLGKRGNIAFRLASFEESVGILDISEVDKDLFYEPMKPIESVYRALVLGVRDYMNKCGFSKALLGLSGGIDSAVTAAIAAEAAGAQNVLGITMPSRYSSEESRSDSRELAHNLGIQFKEISIEKIFSLFLEILQPHFQEIPPDITEENIQARIRGLILMAFSNKFGYLLLSTGNKSEIAVGYCTLYGDMNGGLSVISDVPKTMIYKLAEFINCKKKVIPDSIIFKAPSAELRPNQKDQDTLPQYEILDNILHLLIEEGKSVEKIIAQGFDRQIVEWVAAALKKSEYKRRQAAPGIKVTSKAFGMGRRVPIAARYFL